MSEPRPPRITKARADAAIERDLEHWKAMRPRTAKEMQHACEVFTRWRYEEAAADEQEAWERAMRWRMQRR